MRYDQDYLKTLYENHTLEEFLDVVKEDKIDDPHTRAIVSTLKRSVRTLNLQFNPIIIKPKTKKSQETNTPHQQ